MNKPLVLWGGVDINPHLYNEISSKYTQNPNLSRDSKEWCKIQDAIDDNHPIIGVCRGAQLLCAYTGGRLIQHSVPHIQNHSIETKDGQLFDNVPADHHQIMVPNHDNSRILAINPNPTRVWYKDENYTIKTNLPEVVYWPYIKAIGIQPHPEWCSKNEPFLHWINLLLKQLEIDYEF